MPPTQRGVWSRVVVPEITAERAEKERTGELRENDQRTERNTASLYLPLATFIGLETYR